MNWFCRSAPIEVPAQSTAPKQNERTESATDDDVSNVVKVVSMRTNVATNDKAPPPMFGLGPQTPQNCSTLVAAHVSKPPHIAIIQPRDSFLTQRWVCFVAFFLIYVLFFSFSVNSPSMLVGGAYDESQIGAQEDMPPPPPSLPSKSTSCPNHLVQSAVPTVAKCTGA
jgi:hypothetical protein